MGKYKEYRRKYTDQRRRTCKRRDERQGGETYTWKDITNGEGTPIYSSKEEWEQEERTVIADWREEVEADKQTLAEYWNEYTEQKKEYKNGTFEEEMKKVLDYWREYQSFLEGKSLGENDNG